MGKEKITSNADVAWLFRALETEAVESAYAVHVKADGSYFVQHLSIGTANATVIDLPAITATAIRMKSKKVFLVHNHPSGNIVSSNADRSILSKLKDALRGTAEVKGIIINVNHGIYGEFDDFNPDVRMTFDEKDWKQSELVQLN